MSKLEEVRHRNESFKAWTKYCEEGDNSFPVNDMEWVITRLELATIIVRAFVKACDDNHLAGTEFWTPDWLEAYGSGHKFLKEMDK